MISRFTLSSGKVTNFQHPREKNTMREKLYINIPHAKAKGLFHWNNALLFKPIPSIKKERSFWGSYLYVNA